MWHLGKSWDDEQIDRFVARESPNGMETAPTIEIRLRAGCDSDATNAGLGKLQRSPDTANKSSPATESFFRATPVFCNGPSAIQTATRLGLRASSVTLRLWVAPTANQPNPRRLERATFPRSGIFVVYA